MPAAEGICRSVRAPLGQAAFKALCLARKSAKLERSIGIQGDEAPGRANFAFFYSALSGIKGMRPPGVLI